MTQEKSRLCRACRQAEMQPTTRERVFGPRGQAVPVELLTSCCPACGSEETRAAQHSENLRRLKARKANYGHLLLGEEILSLRRRYGITQQAAAKIFGKGKIAFSRYENETSYPDDSTTRLLQLAIEKMDVIRWLADKADVELPLWAARCEDERKQKLRVIADVRKVDAETSSWAKTGAAGQSCRAMGQTLLRKWPKDASEQPRSATSVNHDLYMMHREAYR